MNRQRRKILFDLLRASVAISQPDFTCFFLDQVYQSAIGHAVTQRQFHGLSKRASYTADRTGKNMLARRRYPRAGSPEKPMVLLSDDPARCRVQNASPKRLSTSHPV